MGVVKISFNPRSKTYFSVTVHSVHNNTLRDAQKSCIRMISRHTSRVFCELRSQKTPRGISPMNSKLFHTTDQLINIFHFLSFKECRHTIHNLLSCLWINEICRSYRYCGGTRHNDFKGIFSTCNSTNYDDWDFQCI